MRGLTPALASLPGNIVLPACHLAPLLGVDRRTLLRWRQAGLGPEPLAFGDYVGPAHWYAVHQVRAWMSGTPEPAPGPYFSGSPGRFARMKPWRKKGARARSGAFNGKMKEALAYADMIVEEARLGLPLSTSASPFRQTGCPN
jgi:hypothetical protein